MRSLTTDVCVVGGGPAGLVHALLLARAGIDVTVLEKHEDFLRDFRGDTVHASTIALMDSLGLGEALMSLPHRKVTTLRATFADATITLADFSTLPGKRKFIAFLPQWDFLDLLAEQAAQYPTFRLLRRTEAIDLIRDQAGAVTGVRARDPNGEVDVHAALTVATDGRFSVVRERLGWQPKQFGAPMDVLWFRLPRRGDDGDGLDLRVGPGRLFICIDRGDNWQIACVIRKGGYDDVVAAGLPEFRASVARQAPFLTDRVGQISDWDQVKVLTVQVNRLPRWHGPGVLLLGDAAHAMSPMGGVGINLAVQDAVAAARLLLPALKAGTLDTDDLAQVRRRRSFPTVGTQLLQRIMQRQFLAPVLAARDEAPAPLAMRLVSRVPAIRARVSRIIGIGLRPELP